MKRRFFLIGLLLFVALLPFLSSKTSIRSSKTVILLFNCGAEDINIILTEDEANNIVSILDGNRYNSLFDGAPACGFDKSVSLKIENRVYAIALDSCNHILDYGNLRYFSIKNEDMEYIHALFQKYGGYFPCV